MGNELSAAGFSFNRQIYFGEFEILLSKIASCYHLMVQDKVQLLNDENNIRNVLLLNYLKKNEIRCKIGLTEFLFDREVPEDYTIGRTDLKIQTKDTFVKTEAYYIIECKRLNNKATHGISGLNAEYIKNGVFRFTTSHYTSHYGLNALIGFIVEPMDIHKNADEINFLLQNHFPQANTTIGLSRAQFIPNFEYHYRSMHLCDDKREITLYHVMFDFSDNFHLG